MNDNRRNAQRLAGFASILNLIPPEETLKIREGSKYTEIKTYLIRKRIDHEFEYRIDDAIFDLAITSQRFLVEFDGPHHRSRAQLARDKIKNAIGRSHGWSIVRIVTGTSNIPADVLSHLI